MEEKHIPLIHDFHTSVKVGFIFDLRRRERITHRFQRNQSIFYEPYGNESGLQLKTSNLVFNTDLSRSIYSLLIDSVCGVTWVFWSNVENKKLSRKTKRSVDIGMSDSKAVTEVDWRVLCRYLKSESDRKNKKISQKKKITPGRLEPETFRVVSW